MYKNKILGLIGLVGAGFVGGAIMPSIIRLGTTLLHPFLLNWLRISLGLIIALVFFKKNYRAKVVFTKKNILPGLILGICLGLNITLFSFGVQHTTLIASQLIYTLTPIVTSFIAYLLIKEKVTLKKALGMIVALSGVLILIIFSRSPETVSSLGTFYGNFLIFIGMFGYSSYLAFSKKLTPKFSVIEMVLLTNTSLTLLLLPFAIYSIFLEGTAQLNLNSLGVMVLISAVALIFISLSQLAIKHLSAGTASLGSLLSPEFAALAGIVIYHEKLSPILIVSLVLAISGVIISTNFKQQSFIDKIKQLPQLILNRVAK